MDDNDQPLEPADDRDPDVRDLTEEIAALVDAFAQLERGEEITCERIAEITGLERFTSDWRRMLKHVAKRLADERGIALCYHQASDAWRLPTASEQVKALANRRRRAARIQCAKLAVESGIVRAEDMNDGERRLAAFNVFHAQQEGKRLKQQDSEFKTMAKEIESNNSAARQAINGHE